MHIHEIKDAEAHFIINATSREISNAAELPALVQHDHNSERFTFVVPRYVDGHDLSICNRVRVHYINVDSATKEQYADVYEVDDLHIDETDETKVVCTWLLSRYATQHAGSLNFIVEYACVSNNIIDYAWHTAIFKGITVKASIHNAEQIMTEYTDILEKWKNDILSGFEPGGGSGGDVDLSNYATKNDLLTDKIETNLTTTTIEPNKYYSFGEVAELTIEFAEGVAEKVNEYMFGFVSGETETILALPSSVQWANEITVEPNKRYEISIVDNIALWCAVDLAVSE